MTKTYRLINIKSTTPEELYAHKVCKTVKTVICYLVDSSALDKFTLPNNLIVLVH